MSRLVLDTSFILPFLGVEVEGVDPGLVEEYAEQGYELLYPLLAVPELLGVLAKVVERRGLGGLPPEALEGLEALLAGEDVKLVAPRLEHLETALRLRLAGHRDLFDCILYATALHEEASLLTLDGELLESVRRAGFDPAVVLLVRR